MKIFAENACNPYNLCNTGIVVKKEMVLCYESTY